MTGSQILFLLTGAVILASAFMCITVRKMIHAALFFVLALLGTAVLFAMLEAGFFAVIQVLIYVGAIAILIIFAVMLTQRSLENRGKHLNASTLITLIVVIVIFSGLVLSIRRWVPIFGVTSPLPKEAFDLGNLGIALTNPQEFALPFEVTSILLLAAMIGSIYIAYERKDGKK